MDYERALQYYYGNHPLPITVEDNMPDDNVVINMVRMVGDRTAQFLFPEPPKFETDIDSLEDTEEEIWLRELFEKSGGLAFFNRWAVRGYLSGHTFLRVMPPKFPGDQPFLTLYDPTQVVPYWDAENPSIVLWYELRYAVGEDFYMIDFYRKGLNSWGIDKYINRNRVDGAGGTFYERTVQQQSMLFRALWSTDLGAAGWELVQLGNWESNYPPIIDVPHLPDPDKPYGMSEVANLRLQDTINRIFSLMNMIVRKHSTPVDVITGADVDDVDNSTEDLFAIASPGAKVTRLELKGDLAAVDQALERAIIMYLALARVVLLRGEVADLQRVTNASVKTLFLDALAKNTLLWSSYSAALKIAAATALEIGYANRLITNNPVNLDIQVVRAEPLPTDMLEVAQINAMGITGGYMSRQDAATRLGLNWARTSSAIKAEHDVMMERQVADAAMMQTVSPNQSNSEQKERSNEQNVDNEN
jgi:hypothetical protein